MSFFDHEKLDVYKASIKFVILIELIGKQLPKSRYYLVDQLYRAGTSIVLNIAEGAGEFSLREKIRFYRLARRSATECASILDICKHLNLINDELCIKSRNLLLRIVSMLIKMVSSL